jgi:hypothetical protein
MTPSARLRAASAAVLMICAALLLGACGNSEGGSSSAEDTTKAQEPPPARQFSVKTGVTKGYVDSAQVEGDTIVLTGWAAAVDLSKPATFVAGKVGGKTVAEAVPAIERGDVAAYYGKAGLKHSGFELRVPLASLKCSQPAAGLKVFAGLGSSGSPLALVEGTKPKLESSC